MLCIKISETTTCKQPIIFGVFLRMSIRTVHNHIDPSSHLRYAADVSQPVTDSITNLPILSNRWRGTPLCTSTPTRIVCSLTEYPHFTLASTQAHSWSIPFLPKKIWNQCRRFKHSAYHFTRRARHWERAQRRVVCSDGSISASPLSEGNEPSRSDGRPRCDLLPGSSTYRA